VPRIIFGRYKSKGLPANLPWERVVPLVATTVLVRLISPIRCRRSWDGFGGWLGGGLGGWGCGGVGQVDRLAHGRIRHAAPEARRRGILAVHTAGRPNPTSPWPTCERWFESKALGPWTIHVDADVLEAYFGTRTAAITAAYVAVRRCVEESFCVEALRFLKDSVAAVRRDRRREPVLDGTTMRTRAEVDHGVEGEKGRGGETGRQREGGWKGERRRGM